MLVEMAVQWKSELGDRSWKINIKSVTRIESSKINGIFIRESVSD